MDAEERVARWIYHKARKPFPEGEIEGCTTTTDSGSSSCGYGTCREEYTEFSAQVYGTRDGRPFTSYASFETSISMGLGQALEELIEFEKEQHPLMEINTDGR